ncbi:hypothetical protein RAD10_24965 [Bradyrhizobium sp. 23AC]
MAATEGEMTLAQMAERFDLHPNRITKWKFELRGMAVERFGPDGGNRTSEPTVGVKTLHAMTRKLTLGNDSFKNARSAMPAC